MSGSASSSARNPARTSAWSSASSTSIMTRSARGPAGWAAPATRKPPPGRGPRGQRTRRAPRPARACPAMPLPPPASRVGAASGAAPSSSTCTVEPVRRRSCSRTVAVGRARRAGGCWSAPPARSGRRPGRPRRGSSAARSPSTAHVDRQAGRARVGDQLVELGPGPGSRAGAAAPRRRRAARRASSASRAAGPRLDCLIAVSAVAGLLGVVVHQVAARPRPAR